MSLSAFRTSKATDTEDTVERFLVKRVKENGGFTLKLKTFMRGLPDRFVFLPGGVFALAELKRPKGGKFEPLQLNWQAKFRMLGFRCEVLTTKHEVETFIQGLVKCDNKN